jgi:hypothetical protein
MSERIHTSPTSARRYSAHRIGKSAAVQGRCPVASPTTTMSTNPTSMGPWLVSTALAGIRSSGNVPALKRNLLARTEVRPRETASAVIRKRERPAYT